MANSNPNRQLFTKESVLNIINNRKDYGIIGRADVGNRLRFTVQGNGNIIPVTKADGTAVESRAQRGTVLMKKIWNLKAISQIAMLNPVVKDFLRKGIEAEVAGNFKLADELYNSYLNKVQVSFSVLLPHVDADKFGNNDQINATVDLISNDVMSVDGKPTGEKRELLTVKDISVARIESAAKKTAAFMLDDLLGIADTKEAVSLFQPASEIPAEVGAGEQSLAEAELDPAAPTEGAEVTA